MPIRKDSPKESFPKGPRDSFGGVVVHAANLHDGVMAQSERIPLERRLDKDHEKTTNTAEA